MAHINHSIDIVGKYWDCCMFLLITIVSKRSFLFSQLLLSDADFRSNFSPPLRSHTHTGISWLDLFCTFGFYFHLPDFLKCLLKWKHPLVLDIDFMLCIMQTKPLSSLYWKNVSQRVFINRLVDLNAVDKNGTLLYLLISV